MVVKFFVHKQTFGHWPAKNGKPAGESYDIDLIDMSSPPQHAYRGMLPYRLTPDERQAFWDKVERKFVEVAVHEILHTQRGPVVRGQILRVSDTGND